MIVSNDNQPAEAGSLQADVLADLVALSHFVSGRDRALQGLFDGKVPRSHLRDELIRMIVIDFGFGRLRTIAHYRRSCVHLGKPFETRNEIQVLVEHKMVVLLAGRGRRLGWHVCPTQKLIGWYSNQLPLLMKEVIRYMSARGAALPEHVNGVNGMNGASGVDEMVNSGHA